MAEHCRPKNSIRKCCIIGLGLIGGSLGLALGKHNLALERWGYDLDLQTMKGAQKKGAVDKTGPLADSLRDADLVILATPVGKIPSLLSEIAPYLSHNTLVTDVGSCKREIVEAMQNMPPGITFLGGHPMAGSELSGIAAANADLFKEAVYFLTPNIHTPVKMLELMQKIVISIGARPKQITPGEHDRIMAPLSHLPKLLAVALVNVLGKYSAEDNSLLSLAGRGFKDTTRIAAGEPQLWLDIFENNKDNLKDALSLLLGELQAIAAYLDGGDKISLTNSLEQAAHLRGVLANIINDGKDDQNGHHA